MRALKVLAVAAPLGLAVSLSGARAATVTPLPPPGPGAVAGGSSPVDGPDPSPPVDLTERSGLPLEAYGDSLDYDVSYDDAVAAKYDDGYDPDAYAQFDAALAPYGTWIDDPAYGRIWVPETSVVGADFTPYATNGDWLDTEYGWTWSSGWAWGWAPFHYGRWVCLDQGQRQGAGWGWVPGTLWGPAWVSWRAGGGYVGWAPLPPRGVSMGSPIGAHSAWRFTAVANLGRAHGAYLSPRYVPSVFVGTTVVSNARLLPSGDSVVRVNAGPAMGIRGGVTSTPPVHLAIAAPRTLPRLAIQPHAGTSVAGRPWVRAGVTTQFSSGPWPRRARDLRVAEGPGRGPLGSGQRPGSSVGQGQRYEPSSLFGGRAFSRPTTSSGTFIVPFRSPSSARSGGSTGQPAFTASSPSFTAAPPSFTAPPANFSSAAPFYSRPSAPAFHGGGTHSSGGRHR